MDKETVNVFRIDQATIDDFKYYSVHRAYGTVVYLYPNRVRRKSDRFKIATEPTEEEKAIMAHPKSVGGTKVVFHKDYAEIVRDKTKVVPPRTQTPPNLTEASKKLVGSTRSAKTNQNWQRFSW